MLKCVLNDERQLAEVVVRVLPKAFVMCEAKSAAHWSLVTQGCTPRCKSSAEWGENSAKGDSLLNMLQLQNACNQGSKFKDSRKGEKEQNRDQKSREVRERRKKNSKILFLDNIQLIRCKNISKY